MDSILASLKTWFLANLQHAVRIAIFLVVASALVRILHKVLIRIEKFSEDDDPSSVSEREKRAKTLGSIIRQFVSVLIWSVTIMLVLSELGVDLKPILAGAGVAGLAIGFGAQTLVKDVITGFFILLENQFRVNDVISTSGVSGSVEAINLRTTVLRDVEGRVHVIPNGSITVVTNLTRDWSRALLDIGVAYKEDTDRCIAIMREVGEDMEKDPAYALKLLGPFEYPGVEAFGDSAVVLRVMVRTQPQERWNVVRELRRRVKFAFDGAGIEIPFPHRTVILHDASRTPPA
jgi:small conductance mechanosensitive channel